MVVVEVVVVEVVLVEEVLVEVVGQEPQLPTDTSQVS